MESSDIPPPRENDFMADIPVEDRSKPNDPTTIGRTAQDKEITNETDEIPAVGTKRVLQDMLLPGGASQAKRIAYSKCGIPNCRYKSNRLETATSEVLTYYGVKNKSMKLLVCPRCALKAKDFEQKSIDAIKGIECMFNHKHEPQPGRFSKTVNVNVRENGEMNSPTTSLPNNLNSEIVEVDFDRADVGNIVDSIMKKYKISTQVNLCKKKLKDEMKEFEVGMKELEKTATSVEQELYNACKSLRAVFDPPPTPMVIQEVEINADGSIRMKRVAESKTPFPKNKPKLLSGESLEAPRVPLSDCPSVIPRVSPQVGDVMYAMNKIHDSCWVQAEILYTIMNPDLNETEYAVQFEPTKDGMPTNTTVDQVNGSVRLTRQVCLKELAYITPMKFLLPVGIRVIAKFTDGINNGCYYSGVVAEPAKKTNGFRYLIFFDDAYAQYVIPEEVLLICESNREVWNDVHPDNRDFIKDYIIKYPDWPKVKLTVDSLVSTEWHGRWTVSRVLEVDCSLARVRFECDGREEWIYRGSVRFRPIFIELRKSKNFEGRKIPLKNHQANIIENEAAKVASEPKTEWYVKKSTGRTAPMQCIGSDLENSDLSSYLSGDKLEDDDTCAEFQGTTKKVILPHDAPVPKDFTSHDCTPNCVIKYIPPQDGKRRSPLQIPLLFGWAREIGKCPRQIVFYRAPCGRRIRSDEELTMYLQITNSNMSVDFFCFDNAVNCLNEFIPARALYTIEDISDGKELVPIECVNSIDHDTLPHIEYITEVVKDSIEISEDDEFLVCCDCTDNCEDKEKCACWKLTMEGCSFHQLNQAEYKNKGYENRRLLGHIVSGVYECNKRCQCKKTCTNRLTQNGVIWPIQVFKTARKGWGIRTLYDMPEGTFICIYTGEVLSEHQSVDHLRGDEYLAELDFIESVQGIKADYESDVTDIEDENESQKESPLKISEVESSQRSFATRRTGGEKEYNYVLNCDKGIITARDRKNRKECLRKFYEYDKKTFLVDSKFKGNFGRFLNHSCSPNVFVQNVFINTHDLRLPEVAFFTNTVIKAGSELTWDYQYQIGSVPGKEKYCYCMTPYCRSRLL